MAIREILLLGNENLYKVCKEISKDEMAKAKQIVEDLHDTIINFREKYGFGRAIAAPQINEPFRIIYLNIDNDSTVFINPRLVFVDEEKFEMWDDCMSYPGLEVKLYRYKKCKIYYKDLEWNDCVLDLEGDLSELIQHEYDHLDGILAVQRAIDDKSFRINKMKSGCF
ncbi:peptide deformylase [Geosporobacter ferrireducens]|uniref:Peptide deformylase n=1 Tax=Geosporobacter ferrireducens TaxID=1424294 RepID=A0A1D8GNV3_9FIRM|nr:peptide deformylase [Geosporobacter ferrireducens]AOT72555.1 formylmethionine deformylase [Geosporobacter ferrireducens]MTI54948.1 peptide deformylase [Geosporobacter ferrireducens]